MLSSMAKLWPVNFGHLGVHWILGLFRYIHLTFLKNFPSSGIDRRCLNGNTLRDDEANSKVISSASPDANAVEIKPTRAPTQIDGKARKGRKEMNRKGKITGKTSAQMKQKTQKLRKNEIETGKNSDCELFSCSIELKNPNQEYCSEVKNMEEERFEDFDNVSLSLREKFELEFLVKVNDAVEVDEAEDGSECLSEIIPYQLNHGMDISNAVQSTKVATETKGKEVVSSGRNRTRKKRRKGPKGCKQPPSATVSYPGAHAQPNENQPFDINTDLVGKAGEPPKSSIGCVVTVPAVNSTMFGGSALGNSRQKPSARVHPSRSMSTTDCALNSSDFDLSPELKASAVDFLCVDSKNEAKLCCTPNDLYQNSLTIMSCVEPSEKESKTLEVVSLSDVVMNSVQKSCGIEVNNDALCHDSVSSHCQLSPVTTATVYELPHIGKCRSTRLKPRNLVNPFPVFDFDKARPSHTGLHGIDVKSNYVEPPRFRPRSMVNPFPAGPQPNRTDPNVMTKHATSDLDVVQGSVDFHVTRTTRVNESPVVSEERSAFTAVEYVEVNSREFTRLNNSSDSFPSVDDCGQAAVDRISYSFHGNGFLGNQESSHSIVQQIRRKTGRSFIESGLASTRHRLITSKQSVCSRGNPDQDPNPGPNPAPISSPVVHHCDLRNLTAKESDSFGKKPPNRPRNFPKNGKSVGFRTNSFRQKSIESNESRESNHLNFDIWRAQQFLHAEFLTVVDKRKQKSHDVVIVKCN